MLDPNYGSWSRDRIREEIQNRRDYIQTLRESIEYHRQEYERFPEGGYGARDLETAKANAEWEIAELTDLL
jgi:hypothetical protein